MRKKIITVSILIVAALFLGLTALELNAEARAGGGSRSMGSRGSRSYSRPAARSSPQQNQYRQQQSQPPPSQIQQPTGGGFLRSMAGGIVGGMLGGMLFRSLGMAGGGMGGMGGGGIGLFEIALLAGIGYFIYRFIKNKRNENVSASTSQESYQRENVIPFPNQQQSYAAPPDDLETGLNHIRQLDPSFDENRFNDSVMDNFFKIQGAWMNRDLSTVSGLLTNEMRGIFQADIDQLLRDKRINRLENIAVRNVEIAEVWQESGHDFITASIYANLLDYTTDDSTGSVVSGSKTDPVKFEEYWTFTRPVGNNQWQLSAISQK